MSTRAGILLFSAILFFARAQCDEISYQLQDTPIKIQLPVGEERHVVIKFAHTLNVGVPAESSSKLNLQIIGNQIWLTAMAPFENIRVVVLARPRERIIFDISASESYTDTDQISVYMKSDNDQIEERQPHYGFAALTRWATQQLYSPKRLLTELPGVIELPVSDEHVDLFRCGDRAPTLCAGGVSATPVASWQTPSHFVTAVQISNKLDEPITLDPRELKGAWRTASFIHSRLGKHGYSNDSTVLVLISDFPFSDSTSSW